MRETEDKIGYHFHNPALLENALTHSSYANETKCASGSNERLEFLGDSVLGMITADDIYRKNPDLPEGKLTRLRAALVCEDSLVEVADQLGLSECLRLGHGECAAGHTRSRSIRADAVEAIIAAVYLDGGLAEAKKFIDRFILVKEESALENKDAKTALQEEVQKKPGGIVTYRLLSESGPDHCRTFTMEAVVNGTVRGTGSGRSKKEAEQAAAAYALEACREGETSCA